MIFQNKGFVNRFELFFRRFISNIMQTQNSVMIRGLKMYLQSLVIDGFISLPSNRQFLFCEG